uniref:Uncharacterized protein n=1 Tax=Cacopsylla melanoneura TaxID=428564 RepID=A0A8D8WTZ1_9HEMI
MKIIKVAGKEGKAKLSTEYPLFGHYLGVYSLYINYDNMVYISQDDVLSIRNKDYVIKKGYHNVADISPIEELKFSLGKDRKIQVESSKYFHIGKSLCQDLGLEYKSTEYSLVGIGPVALGVRYYIDIDKDCSFIMGDADHRETYTISKGLLSLNQLSMRLTKNIRFETYVDVDETFSLVISSKLGYKFDDHLSALLGFDPKKKEHIPFTKDHLVRLMTSDKVPKLKTKPCFIGLNGRLIIPTEGVDNFHYDPLKEDLETAHETIGAHFPKFSFSNNIVTITGDKYFELDGNLPEKFKVNPPTSFSQSGIQSLLLDITHKMFEVHCDVVEKSITSSNLIHIEEEILFTFSISNKNYVIPHEVLFLPITQKKIHHIIISIFSVDGEPFFIPEFTVYLLFK